MILRKNNVQVIARTEREIRRLKKDGFVEIKQPTQSSDCGQAEAQSTLLGIAEAPAPAQSSEQDQVAEQGAGDSPAPFADLTVKEIKAKLDKLGVKYGKTADRKELCDILAAHTAGDAE